MKKGKLFAAINTLAFAALSTGIAGTFAWYTINSAIHTGVGGDATGTLTIDQTASAYGAATVTFGVTWTEDEDYPASKTHFVDDSGNEYVWQNGALVEANSGANTNPFGVMTVQIGDVRTVRFSGQQNAVNYSDLSADQKAVIAGNYTLRVTASSNRIHFYTRMPTTHYIQNSVNINVSAVVGRDSATPTQNDEVTFFYTIDGANGEVGETSAFSFSFSLVNNSYTPLA